MLEDAAALWAPVWGDGSDGVERAVEVGDDVLLEGGDVVAGGAAAGFCEKELEEGVRDAEFADEEYVCGWGLLEPVLS